MSVSVYTLRMTKLLTLLLVVAHLNACVWYAGPALCCNFSDIAN
jgi:hypothetical protein